MARGERRPLAFLLDDVGDLTQIEQHEPQKQEPDHDPDAPIDPHLPNPLPVKGEGGLRGVRALTPRSLPVVRPDS